MKMYCEKCSRIIDDTRCPACGSKKVRTPEPADLCFLTEQDYLSTGILSDVLEQNGIPFMKKDVMGAGMAIKVGPMLERTRFYVPYPQLADAETVVEELLFTPPDGEGTEQDADGEI